MVPRVDGRVTLGRRRRAKRVATGVGWVPQLETVDWHFPATVREVVLMGRWSHRSVARLDDAGGPASRGRAAGAAGHRRPGRPAHPRAVRRPAAARLPGAGDDRRPGPAAPRRADERRRHQDARRHPAPARRPQPRRHDDRADHARAQRGRRPPAVGRLRQRPHRRGGGPRRRSSPPTILGRTYGADLRVVRQDGHRCSWPTPPRTGCATRCGTATRASSTPTTSIRTTSRPRRT